MITYRRYERLLDQREAIENYIEALKTAEGVRKDLEELHPDCVLYTNADQIFELEKAIRKIDEEIAEHYRDESA